MPGRDGTGPAGAGPATMGPCGDRAEVTGLPRRGVGLGRGFGPGHGFGLGRGVGGGRGFGGGRGAGGGRGWRRLFYATGLTRWQRSTDQPVDAEGDLGAMRRRARELERQLGDAKGRIETLERNRAAAPPDGGDRR